MVRQKYQIITFEFPKSLANTFHTRESHLLRQLELFGEILTPPNSTDHIEHFGFVWFRNKIHLLKQWMPFTKMSVKRSVRTYISSFVTRR